MAESGQKSRAVDPPAVFSSVKPVLMLTGLEARAAVDLYKYAFNAEELVRLTFPQEGQGVQPLDVYLYSEIRIGDTVLIVCDETDPDAQLGVSGRKMTEIHLRVECEDYMGIVAKLAVQEAKFFKLVAREDEVGSRLHSGNERRRRFKVVDRFGVSWIIVSIALSSGNGA